MNQNPVLGTKAETLHRIAPLLSRSKVAELFYFETQRWKVSRQDVLSEIQVRFKNEMLAVRSSALNEDMSHSSMAGAYVSILDIDCNDKSQLSSAIEAVIDSYSEEARNQVLVQKMVDQIAVCGVITNYELNTGSPYYIVNFDDFSGRADTVTGGVGANKTVWVHRSFQPHMVTSPRVLRWIEFVREIEDVLGAPPLDIEFIETKSGEIFLLQVRRLAVEPKWDKGLRSIIKTSQNNIEAFIEERSRPRPSLLGKQSVFGEMPDWNPAEIIGTSPRPLAASLYRYLITDEIWREARGQMGYRNPTNESLMVQLGGRPYIDVRCSFNSFLPADLETGIGEKVIDMWIERLIQNPELHDKVEFEVAHTAYDFSFKSSFKNWYLGKLSPEELSTFERSLRTLTNRFLSPGSTDLLNVNLGLIDLLSKRQKDRSSIYHQNLSIQHRLRTTKSLLDECKTFGTLPFAIIARFAFVAESLLRSAVARGAMSATRVNEFKTGLETITSTMSQHFLSTLNGDMSAKDFLNKYGHLRPGTYDLLSLRYDQRTDLFAGASPRPHNLESKPFALTRKEEHSLDELIKEAGFQSLSVEKFFSFAKKAIAGREYAKFIFSRNLSDALECIAQLGEQLNCTRDQMSYVPIDEVLRPLFYTLSNEIRDHYIEKSREGAISTEMARATMLSYLIRNTSDIYVVPLHRSAPNFITGKRLEAPTVYIDNRMESFPDLNGKVVCIENADPGFDWIFTRDIAGLITKFGGSNSHMAIRCAEFDLPAAIGCGEQTFNRITASRIVELNCAEKIVRPVYD